MISTPFEPIPALQRLLGNLTLWGAQVLEAFPMSRRLGRLEDGLSALRSSHDVEQELAIRFQKARQTSEYRAAFENPDPLVSICVATYNRGLLLTERTIKSLLAQTHTNIEIIIVGDCCSDDTAERVAKITDSRLRFVNLSERGRYPEHAEWRWMVAGTTPMNHALGLARGDFITHLDDDDEHAPDRIAKLLQLARKTRADLVWHPFWYEYKFDYWQLTPALHFRMGQVTTSSAFYHRWLGQIPWNIDAWRQREPGDWNRFRKFKYIGIHMVRHPEPLLKHYKERNRRVGNA
ncbi:glycosyltransferase family 2 protein [Methylomagnum sp.]